MKIAISCAALALAVSLCAPAAAQTSAAPQRHLVYSFTYGATTDVTIHDSGFNNNGTNAAGGGNGMEDYTDRAGDTGTITVDVMREEQDTGLVLTVSETGSNPARSAKPATCVVYGTGSVICDPNATVNPEEYSVIRLLGAHFVNPSLLDSKLHWQISSQGPQFSATSDYTIVKNDGGLMQIDESRKLTYQGSRTGSADVTNTIGYDFNRQIPTSLDEITSDHGAHPGPNEIDTTVTVDAKLITDSMASATATTH
ncbi:MAG TPA: hypothetical protein VMF11_10880 [Candidatus Baltobacteraceae bacterium]|nr:hypothetical protein [Candidatus Baltobacteraceae bacterium]